MIRRREFMTLLGTAASNTVQTTSRGRYLR